MEKEIKEIRCKVKRCAYNKDESKCMAGNIEVGTSSACSCGETQCSTFTPCSSEHGCE